MPTETFNKTMALQQIKLARLHQAFANLSQSQELKDFLHS